MTTEEAINYLKEVGYQKSAFSRRELFYEEGSYYKQAVDALEAALRAQQTPAKLDRSRWKWCEMCSTKWSKEDWGEGGAHDFRINGDTLYYFDAQFGWEGIKIKYCPFCGRPLTEEAWAELERRIEVTMRLIDAEPIIEMLKRVRKDADSPRRDLDLLNLQQLLEYAPRVALPPNDPLTLEELREMDGPVWCFVADCDWILERGYWCLCQHGEIVVPSGNRFDCDNIPDWIFYRRKPEENG